MQERKEELMEGGKKRRGKEIRKNEKTEWGGRNKGNEDAQSPWLMK